MPPARAALLDTVLGLVSRPKSPTGAARADPLLDARGERRLPRPAPHPGDRTDIDDADGVVYRFFPDSGFASTRSRTPRGSTGSSAAAGRRGARARRRARRAHDAAARRLGRLGVRVRLRHARAPWTSGMAQAVMAQALARAGTLDLARSAFEAIPGALDRAAARRAVDPALQLELRARAERAAPERDLARRLRRSSGRHGRRRLLGAAARRRRRRCCRASTRATGRATRSASSRRSATTTSSSTC